MNYYTFLETGDKQFFSDLIKTFCKTYVENIGDFYSDVTQENSYKLDNDLKEKHMRDEEVRKRFNIFNCSSVLMTADCPNACCKAEHTTVLAKDQREKFEKTLQSTKTAYVRSRFSEDDKKKWYEIQNIFQNHNMLEFFKVQHLHFEANDPQKYLDMYVEETNKLSPDQGYAYVHAPAGRSDYPAFYAKTKLPGVVPCNLF
jgi:hypothetical protein